MLMVVPAGMSGAGTTSETVPRVVVWLKVASGVGDGVGVGVAGWPGVAVAVGVGEAEGAALSAAGGEVGGALGVTFDEQAAQTASTSSDRRRRA
jgi:hypothetical protein